MSGLIVFCTRCRREAPHQETREGLCVVCRLEDATHGERQEVARLKAKLARYQALGADVSSLERQLRRARVRLVNQARAVTQDDQKLESLLKGML